MNKSEQGSENAASTGRSAREIVEQHLTGQEPAPIEIGSVPETIRILKDEINNGALPDVYVTEGRLTIIEHVSGTANADAGDLDKPLPVTSTVLTPPRLQLHLAEHTYTYRSKVVVKNKVQTTIEEEVSPSTNALQAVLAARTWPKVPALRGIIGTPVLRGDGTLLQSRGYDERTGLYLAPNVELPLVPDAPTKDEVAECRSFLMDSFLHDFPWVHAADCANYVALMVTPILRRFLRVLTPFGIITATMPSSGKTILTSGPGLLYGQRVLPWTDNDEELRKTITSSLATVEGTMIFDNLAEGTVIDSAILANLVTSNVWSDRLLGGNKIASAPNDRLWLATGNNLATGGDIASRSVWVRLDPKMPRPEQRNSGAFALGDLTQWIEVPENQRKLLYCLLVLVIDWTRAGAERANDVPHMRQFTPWAQGTGGFLAHHGIAGFLANAEEARADDADDAEWRAFFSTWHREFGTDRVTSAALRKSAEIDHSFNSDGHDRWNGTFVTNEQGRKPGAKQLGAILRGQVGRFHGTYVLRKEIRKHDDIALWWVEKQKGDDE